MNKEGRRHYLRWHLPVSIGFGIFTVFMSEILYSGNVLFWHIDWPVRVVFVVETLIGIWGVYRFGYSIPFRDQEHLELYGKEEEWDPKSEVKKYLDST